MFCIFPSISLLFSTLIVLSSSGVFLISVSSYYGYTLCQVCPGCFMSDAHLVCDRGSETQNKREKCNQNSHSLRKFTSGCCSLGDCDDIQNQECVFLSVLKIFIVLTVLWPIFFTHTSWPFFGLWAARGISQTGRGIKWWEWEDEREHCLLFPSLGTEQNRLCEDTCYP